MRLNHRHNRRPASRRAITLIEVSAAAVVNLAIVGIATAALVSLQRTNRLLGSAWQERTELTRLVDSLRHDFRRANALHWDEATEILHVDLAKDQQIVYRFLESSCQRTGDSPRDAAGATTAFRLPRWRLQTVDAKEVQAEADSKAVGEALSTTPARRVRLVFACVNDPANPMPSRTKSLSSVEVVAYIGRADQQEQLP